MGSSDARTATAAAHAHPESVGHRYHTSDASSAMLLTFRRVILQDLRVWYLGPSVHGIVTTISVRHPPPLAVRMHKSGRSARFAKKIQLTCGKSSTRRRAGRKKSRPIQGAPLWGRVVRSAPSRCGFRLGALPHSCSGAALPLDPFRHLYAGVTPP